VSHPEALAPLAGAGEGPVADGVEGPLSLEEVFGGTEREDASDAEAAVGEHAAPAEATAPEATPSAQAPEPDGFSFEAFFGGETTAPEVTSETDEDSESDLDEFQAWLRGLKS
jgi:hypothetical protein